MRAGWIKHSVLKMRLVAGIWLAVWVFGCSSNLPEKPVTSQEQQDTTCIPVAVESPTPDWPPSKSSWVIRDHPQISLKVDEQGKVIHAKLIKSSGITEIDDSALAALKKWKYRAAPSCGIRAVQIEVTVHYR